MKFSETTEQPNDDDFKRSQGFLSFRGESVEKPTTFELNVGGGGAERQQQQQRRFN
jgi:hypothetical protein